MSRAMGLIGVLVAGMAQADVLDMTDYDQIFAAPDADLRTLEDGSVVATLPHGVEIMQSEQGLVSVDTEDAAVGCFVNILANISALEAQCGPVLTPMQADRMASFRTRLLTFYAANVVPAQSVDAAELRFEAFVESLGPSVGQRCESVDGLRDFVDSVLSERTERLIDAMLATPRFPASNPCL